MCVFSPLQADVFTLVDPVSAADAKMKKTHTHTHTHTLMAVVH